jgi:hypothetical protein
LLGISASEKLPKLRFSIPEIVTLDKFLFSDAKRSPRAVVGATRLLFDKNAGPHILLLNGRFTLGDGGYS